MSVLFTFPGQGSQLPGMLHGLPAHPEVGRTLAEARAVLGQDPLELDGADALASTVAVQTCLLVAGVAMARVLIAEGGRPAIVAGMSVGAFPAAVIAGALDFRDALQLVALRGRLMERAFPAGYGMTAVIRDAATRSTEVTSTSPTPVRIRVPTTTRGRSQRRNARSTSPASMARSTSGRIITGDRLGPSGQPAAAREHRGLHPGPGAGLGEHPRDVRLRRGLADAEPVLEFRDLRRPTADDEAVQ